MSRFYPATVFLFAIILYGFNFIPQQNEYKVEHVSLEKGISNNMVFSIYQDRSGFIWFGTMFGLVRYDGVNYKTFRNDPKDSNSISNDDVISFYEDRDGYLWIGTYFGGMNRYDRKTGTFKRYIHNDEDHNTISSNTVWSILQDKSGAMWFGTNEGGVCCLENNNFTTYQYDSLNTSSIGSNTVNSLTGDREGNIWAGTTQGGLNKFDKNTGRFTRYKRNINDDSSISGNFIRSVYTDKDGRIWAGTIGRGLNLFESETGKFKRFFNITPKGDTFGGINSIYSILDNPENGSKLVSTSNGLFRFTESDGAFNRIRLYDTLVKRQENIVTSLIDNSGVIWVSTYMDGLHKIFKPTANFYTYTAGEQNGESLTNNNIRALYEDTKGNLWIGTFKGLNMLNTDGKFTYYLHGEDNKSISNNLINSIDGDNDGNIWVGTDNGLNKINPVTGEITKFYNDQKDAQSLSSSGITKMVYSKDNTIWLGTAMGLNKYSIAENKFTRYLNNPADTESISENFILSVHEDASGNIWAGTYSGLNMLNKATGKFTRFQKVLNDTTSLSNNYVFSFCDDSKGNLWVGTGGGLNKMDPSTVKFTPYIEANGLPNAVICSIEEDRSGNLWLSTKKGISKFNPADNTFTNFNSDDGLQGNMFNEGAGFKLKGGQIVFGGISGFSIFDPEKMNSRSFKPPVIFTNLTKYNGNEKSVIDISTVKEITTLYSDNILTFEFASLDFTNPAKNKYAYMLEGFENNWVYPAAPIATFTNLDPGTYTLRVKATNSDGIWNNDGASLVITVKPPFWKTWWFYVLVIAAILALTAVIQNYRIRQRIKNLLEIEKVKETERENIREQAARDYHDELGHKLTRISIHSKRIKKKLGASANGITGDLTGIVDTSQSLQRGAKDLIWSLNPHEDSLYDFAVRIKDFGNEIFEDTGIEFTMNDIDENFKNVRLSMQNKRHLIFIFKEAMNNALKYSDSKNVFMNITVKDNHLEITLEDNGKGFNITNDLKGYGLKNMYNRTLKVNGEIDISSQESIGTKIKFNSRV